MIAAVVRADPDWSLLPASTPSRLRELLKRCLEKEPKQRLRDIGDARFELLDSALAAPATVVAAPRGFVSRHARPLAAPACS